MSKCDYQEMEGRTMGVQFMALDPDSAYHLAFGSIKMSPEKKDSAIEKAKKDPGNILHYIHSAEQNFFMDVKKIEAQLPEKARNVYKDDWIFNLYSNKTDILNHFDALIFIAGGIEVSYK